jgi:hypothetical protein
MMSTIEAPMVRNDVIYNDFDVLGTYAGVNEVAKLERGLRC